ncbi:DUF805 domain-containing protein [Bradyrhizobium sp.]|uniref:DUF805 domain-containing protein n=1 Tax=Bradyrhizobium sp. TaxID=376 RepID=UPI0025BFA544|nr:DUF805 domain-containing protein [Bradyrhizobium sp.]
MDWSWLLFRFEGRINRAKLWLAVLVLLCWMVLLTALAIAVTSLFGDPGPSSFGTTDLFKLMDPETYRSLTPADLPLLLVKLVAMPVILWVYFAASVKRLHDRDRSGWWMVPFFILPGVFDQFNGRLPVSYFMMLPGLAVFALGIWGFVEMYCLKGSPKTNRYGADPLALPDTRTGWDQHSEIEMTPHKAGPPPV